MQALPLLGALDLSPCENTALRRSSGRAQSLAAWVLALAVLPAAAAQADTLGEAILQAYDLNPTLRGQRAQLRALDETYVQARAGLRPSISITADASHQDTNGFTASNSDYGVTVSQPLYTGGRVSAQVNAAKGDILSGRETLRQTEATVMNDVITAYADVLRDQEAFVIREKNLEDLISDVAQTETRFKAGDVTRTDVAQSQASQAAARAQLANAQAQLDISRATYASVVGQLPGKLEPAPDLPALPPSLDQAFAMAAQNNPNLRSAQYDERAARIRIAEAQADGKPQLSLRATYGYGNSRSNYSLDIYGREVTASASFSQPLFAGGSIQSEVRQAKERAAAAREQVETTRRDIVMRVSRAWAQLGAARKGIEASLDQVRAATVAYEGMETERRAGQRTTLEVLTAEQVERDAELNLVNARHDVYVAQTNVLALMGMLEARYIVGPIDLYDPAKAFNKVAGKGWTPWEPVLAQVDGIAVPRVRPLAAPPAP